MSAKLAQLPISPRSQLHALFQCLLRVLLPLLAADPEVIPVLHDVRQNGGAREHHMLAVRRAQHAQPQLLQPFLPSLPFQCHPLITE